MFTLKINKKTTVVVHMEFMQQLVTQQQVGITEFLDVFLEAIMEQESTVHQIQVIMVYILMVAMPAILMA